MKPPYRLKIDAFSHIVPARYKKHLEKIAPDQSAYKVDAVPTLHDLDYRFRIMDRFDGLIQVIAPAWPSVEEVADASAAVDLARMLNDGLAELVLKYPDRFVAAIACLPMNNIDAALAEVDRTINDLRFRGVLIYTPTNDKPLDAPEFLPLYEKMAGYDLPILIHPMRSPSQPDYRGEDASKFKVHSLFGWPYETTLAMTRLVFSGIFDKHPNLKFLTHHAGGMVPFLADRIRQFYEVGEMRRGETYLHHLRKPILDYYKLFYADTAIYGNTTGLACAHAFFGADRLLFGIDMPLGDVELGNRNYRQTINAIEAMDIGEEDKTKIYEDNARKLYRLPI